MKKLHIYLADLIHDYASRGPHSFPINIGYVASYSKKLYGNDIEIDLFKYPLDLINAIKKQKPHIIGLSNYTWNLDVNNKIASWVKSLSKDIVTVFGGPDYPYVKEESHKYLRERPDLDFYVLDQGEKGFANIVGRFLGDPPLSHAKRKPLQNCVIYDMENNVIIDPGERNYIENLEEIPSPYLDGILDKFFNKNLIPILETNRGCPYFCTFCTWGKSSFKKILQFPIERVHDEIEYIAKKMKDIDLFWLSDANFGILEKDVEIAKFLRHSKDKYGYPRLVSAAWSKSHSDRVFKMVKILGNMVKPTAFGSFQTMDPKVMANIKRVNLSFDLYKNVQEHFTKHGISLVTELILGLPGETKNTHLNGLRKLFDYKAPSIVCYNLRMIGGSELNSEENRKKFGIKTKYRLIDGGFGRYDERLSIEHEEMVLETDTMSMDDILYFRPIHFLIQLMWNYRYYEVLLNFFKKEQINPIDYIIAIIENTATAPPSIKKLFNDFMKDTYDEWFDSKEELFEYYSKTENFELISEGDFGKLNYKYMYKILLECKNDFDKYLLELAVKMVKKRIQLEEIFRYIKNSYVDFSKGFEKLETSRTIEFNYDIPQWKKDAYKRSLSEYFYPDTKISFRLPAEQVNKLTKLYEQYKQADLNWTLRKMVEYMNERDLFYQANHE